MISTAVSQTNLLLRYQPSQLGIMTLQRGSTSVKAGDALFLYFFHLSPSETTILWPKNATRLY